MKGPLLTIQALISLKEVSLQILTHGLHFVATVLLANTTKDHGQGLHLSSGPGYLFYTASPRNASLISASLLRILQNHHLRAVNCLLCFS